MSKFKYGRRPTRAPRFRSKGGVSRSERDEMFARRARRESITRTTPPSVMPFGKYKGDLISEVPDNYLRWCYENIPDCPTMIVEELSLRGVSTGQSWLNQRQARAVEQGPASPKFMSEMVGRDYKRLRDEFVRAGGDEDECPFDTPDHKYMGPVLAFSPALSVVPGEFPKEYQ